MHSSMQVWHMAMQASSIAIIDAGVMPCIRIIDRIMVLHMSAQFMHAGEQSIICVEHTVQACSHAEHASMHACMTDMSIIAMSGTDSMFFDMAPIIIESIAHRFLDRVRGQDHPPGARLVAHGAGVDGCGTVTWRAPIVNPVAPSTCGCEGRRQSIRLREEQHMSAADDIKNAAEKAAGKVKEGVGKMTDNEKLEAEGKADQVKASAKQAGENVKDAAHKTGDSVRDAFEK